MRTMRSSREPRNDEILKEMITSKAVWKCGASNEVISFLRTNLKHTTKAWFYFKSATLTLSRHVSKVLRDKALLTHAILNGYKFNVGDAIECSIIESENSKAIPYPSLITKICLMAGVDIA